MDDLREKTARNIYDTLVSGSDRHDWPDWHEAVAEELGAVEQAFECADRILALDPLPRLLAADKAANDFNERHA